MDHDYCQYDAVELAAAIRRKEVSSFQIVELAIERIELLNPKLNAIVTPTFDFARQGARAADEALSAGMAIGPLHGVPVLIKDLFDFKAGVRNTFGCPATADFIPHETCAYVERIERAGGIILGKTNTPEFGHKGITDNRLFGPTSTPFDLARNAGGSSGGSAAAVAAGLAPLAQGSDAGGSIRIPAAWCGVVGFKPTFGRVAHPGGANCVATVSPFVHAGPIARTVRDVALMADVMSGPHPRDPLAFPRAMEGLVQEVEQPIAGWKIAFSPDWGVFAMDPEVVEIARQAARSLERAGAVVEEIDRKLPYSQDELAQLWLRQVGILYAEMFASFGEGGMDLLKDYPDDIPPEIHATVEYGQTVSALDARRDEWLRTKVFYAIEDLFIDYDLVATPTLSCRPVENSGDGRTLGPSEVNGEPVERCIGWCLTHPINFSGHPAVSVPAGLLADGLPVGLQIVGRRHADAQVLAACRELEKIRPWFGQFPDLLAILNESS